MEKRREKFIGFIDLQKYQEIIKPDEKLTYSDKSLLGPITMPESGIFFAMHGPTTALVFQGSNATAYTMRKDLEDPKPLNKDTYILQATKDPNIIQIKMLYGLEDHWSNDVPDFMQSSLPDWAEEKIEKIKKLGD
jgi:hypothetical protein